MRQRIERRTPSHHDRTVDGVEVETTEREPALRDLTHEMDEILNEIDEVLEENAEEFVKGYVQKGGE